MPPDDFADTIELLRRAKAGDRPCLDEVIDRYRDRLLPHVEAMMSPANRRWADCGDILHDVLLKAMDRFDRFKIHDESSFLRWTLTIARHELIDCARRRHEAGLESVHLRSGELRGDDQTPSQAAAGDEAKEQLLQALRNMDPQRRKLVELRHFEQLSFAEIGARLEISENAAQLQHKRILLDLAKRLPRDGSTHA